MSDEDDSVGDRLNRLEERADNNQARINALEAQFGQIREDVDEAMEIAEEMDSKTDELEDLMQSLRNIKSNTADVTTRRAVILLRKLRKKARKNARRHDHVGNAASLIADTEAWSALDHEPSRASMYQICPRVAEVCGEAVEYINENGNADAKCRLVLKQEDRAPEQLEGFSTDPENYVKEPDPAGRVTGGAD